MYGVKGDESMDREEAGRLAEKFAPSVYRLAYARTGNRADAEDMMQEAFLKLLSAGPELRDDEHAKAWLLRVAAQRATDLFRHIRRRKEVSLSNAEGLPGGFEPEPGEALQEVLALPANYRIPIHLFYYEEMSVAQIAAVVGSSEEVVKTRLSRGRALLRQRLVKGDEDVV